jgi:hypothetical protein
LTTGEPNPPDMKAAYRIIVTLVDALTASSDLVAVMARLMGENAVRPLQAEPAWQAYLEAKRRLESVHDEMHRFAEAAVAHGASEVHGEGDAPAIARSENPAERTESTTTKESHNE